MKFFCCFHFPYLNDFIISFQKSFILPKYHVLAELWNFSYFVWDFFVKKGSFPAKTVGIWNSQSVPQTHFNSYFQMGKIYPFRKESIFLFLSYFEIFHSRFWRNKIKFLFNSQNLLSSIEQCMWLHLCFLFGKFHIDIHNKMAHNNGTDLLYETDFDITKDGFCWTDIFIKWFEDYQLLCQFARLLILKVEICSACKCNYLQTWLSVL